MVTCFGHEKRIIENRFTLYIESYHGQLTGYLLGFPATLILSTVLPRTTGSLFNFPATSVPSTFLRALRN